MLGINVRLSVWQLDGRSLNWTLTADGFGAEAWADVLILVVSKAGHLAGASAPHLHELEELLGLHWVHEKVVLHGRPHFIGLR